MERKRTFIVLMIIILLGIFLLLLGRVYIPHGAPRTGIIVPWGTYVAQLPDRTVTLELRSDPEQTAVLSETRAGQTKTKSGSWERTEEKEIVVTLPDERIILVPEVDGDVVVKDGTETLPDDTVLEKEEERVPDPQPEQPKEPARPEEGKDIEPAAPSVPEAPKNTQPLPEAPKQQGADPLLLSGQYRVLSYGGVAVGKGEEYTVAFSQGTLSARFCNSMSGSYSLQGNIISAELGMTMMFCEEPKGLMDMERAFGAILGTGAAISADAGGLVTIDGGQGQVFVLEPVQQVSRQ